MFLLGRAVLQFGCTGLGPRTQSTLSNVSSVLLLSAPEIQRVIDVFLLCRAVLRSVAQVGAPTNSRTSQHRHPILGRQNEKFHWPGTSLASSTPEATHRGRFAILPGLKFGSTVGTFNYSDSEHLALLAEVLASRPRDRLNTVLHRVPEVSPGFAMPSKDLSLDVLNAAGHAKLAGATLISGPGFLFPV